jgi:ubiquinone/menaquinone biosynthesis C-methylase UbiE
MGTHLKVEQPTRGHGALEAYLARKRAQKANQLIPSEHRDGRLLDIGCGSFPYFLATTRFSEKWGVDQLFESEARLELGHQHVNLVPFDAQHDARLPFPDEHFSVVTMLAVFEHIAPDRLPLLVTEIRRVLQPGGKFVMTTPAHWTDWLLQLMARTRLVSHLEINEHKSTYSQADIRSTLEFAGFNRASLRSGSFEASANLWATATK